MTITSYAQNFEDIVLWRALCGINHGTYIDIGAQDPVVDSVSLLFYEKGWRGVHIEPNALYAEKIRKSRPDETVIQKMVGEATGATTFFEFPNTGLSTAIPEIAQQHIQAGFEKVESTVESITLDDLLSNYGDKQINWLKIDVEGFELSVLRSWQKSTVRPWILLIESTLPLSQIESHLSWEKFVVDKGYDFVYADGLNRFYVHASRADLKASFRYPPNLFDNFQFSGLASHPFVFLLKAQISELTNARDQLTNARDHLISDRDNLINELKSAVNALELADSLHAKQSADAAINLEKLQGVLQDTESVVSSLKRHVKALEFEKNNDKISIFVLKKSYAAVEEHRSTVMRSLDSKTSELTYAELKEAELNEKLRGLQAQLNAVIESKSWRLSSPLRTLSLQKKLLIDNGLRSRLVALTAKIIRKLAAVVANFLSVYPTLRAKVAQSARRLKLIPPVPKISTEYVHHGQPSAIQTTLQEPILQPQQALSPRATVIKETLENARARTILDSK